MKSMLSKILEAYLMRYPEEKSGLELLLAQVGNNEDLNDRRNFRGHITGSAIILSPDRKHVLLIYHKLFQVWQQPGGHWETDEPNPLAAARREAIEETDVHLKESLSVDPSGPLVPLDIDTHKVPARPEKNEPRHYHHDFRYTFVAADTTVMHQVSEVDAAKWFRLTNPGTKRIERCILKLRSNKFA
jgi:8-oxo-dGTP pyrophosphatase MutT (NUDIX family)